MRQDALVIAGGEIARIMVIRESACSGNCEACGVCESGKPVFGTAYNTAGAQAGERVIIETRTAAVMLSAFLVYTLPLAVFIAAYLIAGNLGTSDTTAALLSAVCAAASFSAALIYNKRNKGKPACSIVDIIKGLD